MATPNVLIALTAYGGWCRNPCVMSVVSLVDAMTAQGWRHNFSVWDVNDVSEARNSVASVVLKAAEYSHLLFVDYDMVFRPQSALRLISSGRPVIGVAYLRRGGSLTGADQFAVHLKEQAAEPSDGIIEVDGIGMGLTAITRETLVAMHATGKLRTQLPDVPGAKVIKRGINTICGFFDRMSGLGGTFVGEDFSFCRRWKELCDGSTYAVIDDQVGHMGEQTWSGRLADVLGRPSSDHHQRAAGS